MSDTFKEVSHGVHVDAVKGAALMRKDMGKCVIERPRRGSSEPSLKARDFGKIVRTEDGLDYFGFTRIPVSQKAYKLYHSDAKQFTDVLGPIENYLRSSCGRLWDDVYSEIRKTLGHCGWAVEHIIRDHINVAVNTWRGVSGKVWVDDEHGVDQVGGYRSQFYVEPETGLLRESPSRNRRRPSRQPKEPSESVGLTDHTEYRLINRIWYFQDYRETEVRVFVKNREHDGVPVYRYQTLKTVVLKRQLSKKELRDAGLCSGHKAITA